MGQWYTWLLDRNQENCQVFFFFFVQPHILNILYNSTFAHNCIIITNYLCVFFLKFPISQLIYIQCMVEQQVLKIYLLNDEYLFILSVYQKRILLFQHRKYIHYIHYVCMGCTQKENKLSLLLLAYYELIIRCRQNLN